VKLFFATPPLSFEQRYGAFAGGGSAVPSLGVLMLAAVAREAGHACTVVDASALGLNEPQLLERLAVVRPDVLLPLFNHPGDLQCRRLR